MNLVYSNKNKTEGLPVTDSGGYQVVRAILKDGTDKIVLIYDSITDKHYINRVINNAGTDILCSKNFEKIEMDSKWLFYLDFFKTVGLIHDK